MSTQTQLPLSSMGPPPIPLDGTVRLSILKREAGFPRAGSERAMPLVALGHLLPSCSSSAEAPLGAPLPEDLAKGKPRGKPSPWIKCGGSISSPLETTCLADLDLHTCSSGPQTKGLFKWRCSSLHLFLYQYCEQAETYPLGIAGPGTPRASSWCRITTQQQHNSVDINVFWPSRLG